MNWARAALRPFSAASFAALAAAASSASLSSASAARVSCSAMRQLTEGVLPPLEAMPLSWALELECARVIWQPKGAPLKRLNGHPFSGPGQSGAHGLSAEILRILWGTRLLPGERARLICCWVGCPPWSRIALLPLAADAAAALQRTWVDDFGPRRVAVQIRRKYISNIYYSKSFKTQYI